MTLKSVTTPQEDLKMASIRKHHGAWKRASTKKHELRRGIRVAVEEVDDTKAALDAAVIAFAAAVAKRDVLQDKLHLVSVELEGASVEMRMVNSCEASKD